MFRYAMPCLPYFDAAAVTLLLRHIVAMLPCCFSLAEKARRLMLRLRCYADASRYVKSAIDAAAARCHADAFSDAAATLLLLMPLIRHALMPFSMFRLRAAAAIFR